MSNSGIESLEMEIESLRDSLVEANNEVEEYGELIKQLQAALEAARREITVLKAELEVSDQLLRAEAEKEGK